jgi:hypothetical protein
MQATTPQMTAAAKSVEGKIRKPPRGFASRTLGTPAARQAPRPRRRYRKATAWVRVPAIRAQAARQMPRTPRPRRRYRKATPWVRVPAITGQAARQAPSTLRPRRRCMSGRSARKGGGPGADGGDRSSPSPGRKAAGFPQRDAGRTVHDCRETRETDAPDARDHQHGRTPASNCSICRPSCRAYGAGPSGDAESHRIGCCPGRLLPIWLT